MPSMRSLIVASCSTLVLGGCSTRSFDPDVPEVAAAYSHKVTVPCPSWLISHKSGFRYCASMVDKVQVPVNMGAAMPKAGTAEPVDETKIDKDSLMVRGEQVYGEVCVACHQGSGEGVAGAFPPLAGSGEYYGDAQNHARIIVHGLQGEIVINGTKWNGVMPPQGTLSNYDIAAVATYERHSWGNDDGVVLPEDVQAVR